MWNRQQVKEQAKQIMKRNYWKMFVVTLIAGILSATIPISLKCATEKIGIPEANKL